MADLFGGDIPIPKDNPRKGDTILSRWTRLSHYRKAEKGSPERCKNCAWLCIRKYAGKYHKCAKMGRGMAQATPATDIRVNHVCDYFEKDSES